MAVFNGMFPIVAGKESAAREFAEAVAGPRRAEFEAQQARVKVSRETWTIQETPMGSFMLVWFEGDVEAAFTDLATAQDDYTVWFRERVMDVNGVDLAASDGGPPPTVVLDWTP